MTNRTIEIDDPSLDPFRDVRERDLRGRRGGFVVESPRVVMRFLDAVDEGRFGLDAIAIAPDLAPEIEARLERMGCPFVRCSEAILTEASGYRFHAGAIAIGRRPSAPPTLEGLWSRIDDGRSGTIVMLAGVTSMDNIGSIFRSIAALGGDAVILDRRSGDPLLRRAIRISMGQVFRVPWFGIETLSEAIDQLRERGFSVYGIENVAGAETVDSHPLADRAALVVGNEANGVPAEILDRCDEIRRIAGPGGLPTAERPGGDDERSLNAGIACAIALHEAMRSRRNR